MGKVVGVIRAPGYGNRDVGRPVLWFSLYTSPHSAALQVFSGDEADALIRASGVYNVADLEGRACYAEEGNGTIEFLEIWPVR